MILRRTAWDDLAEAWMIFSKEGPVWGTLRRAHDALDAADVPHAVVGGLAVFLHGYRRMTTDVDILDKRFAARLHPLLRKDFKRLVDVIRRYPESHGPA